MKEVVNNVENLYSNIRHSMGSHLECAENFRREAKLAGYAITMVTSDGNVRHMFNTNGYYGSVGLIGAVDLLKNELRSALHTTYKG